MPSAPAIQKHFWAPFEPMVKTVEEIVAAKPKVLEVGPGQKPFSRATEFVDWREFPELKGKPVHALNINQDQLPLADKSFDFAYCRHTLEDLYNPFLMCREMDRVARSGYIETPSPIAEAARGVDYRSPPWRGYHHHRYLIWVDDDTLMFLPKYPIIEHIDLGQWDAQLTELLNRHPLYWNTYYFWNGTLKYRLLEHDKDFRILKDYPQRVMAAIEQSREYTRQIAAKYFPGSFEKSTTA
jgi:Methyltransferase domain